MKTRDRIIHCALTLFNNDGEANVSTNHIAANLGISTGNLYYYFRNKNEIIHSIFEQYAFDLNLGFQPENRADCNELSLLTYLDVTFGLMWRYRFFYASLPMILSRDTSLQDKYLQAQKTLKMHLFFMLSTFREMGWLDKDDDDLSAICDTLRLVASSWIFYQSAQTPRAKITPSVIYLGVLQILNMLSLMLTDKGSLVVSELIAHYKKPMENPLA